MIPEIISLAPKCNMITIGTKTYYYSYNTLVGFKNKDEKIKIPPIGKTTTKHLTMLGIKEFPTAKSREDFLSFIEKE